MTCCVLLSFKCNRLKKQKKNHVYFADKIILLIPQLFGKKIIILKLNGLQARVQKKLKTVPKLIRACDNGTVIGEKILKNK